MNAPQSIKEAVELYINYLEKKSLFSVEHY